MVWGGNKVRRLVSVTTGGLVVLPGARIAERVALLARVLVEVARVPDQHLGCGRRGNTLPPLDPPAVPLPI